MAMSYTLIQNPNSVQGGKKNQFYTSFFFLVVMLSSIVATFILVFPSRMIEIGVNSFPEVFHIEGMAQEVSNIMTNN